MVLAHGLLTTRDGYSVQRGALFSVPRHLSVPRHGHMGTVRVIHPRGALLSVASAYAVLDLLTCWTRALLPPPCAPALGTHSTHSTHRFGMRTSPSPLPPPPRPSPLESRVGPSREGFGMHLPCRDEAGAYWWPGRHTPLCVTNQIKYEIKYKSTPRRVQVSLTAALRLPRFFSASSARPRAECWLDGSMSIGW
jgi:hypothetical protein